MGAMSIRCAIYVLKLNTISVLCFGVCTLLMDYGA